MESVDSLKFDGNVLAKAKLPLIFIVSTFESSTNGLYFYTSLNYAPEVVGTASHLYPSLWSYESCFLWYNHDQLKRCLDDL